jgi:hypothetical protein
MFWLLDDIRMKNVGGKRSGYTWSVVYDTSFLPGSQPKVGNNMGDFSEPQEESVSPDSANGPLAALLKFLTIFCGHFCVYANSAYFPRILGQG